MTICGREDALWRLWHDRSACVARRSPAGLVWHYEQAPMRALLIGPEGLYLLDGLLLAGVRIMLRAPNRIDDGAPGSRVAPSTSGWRGNLVFLAFWAGAIATAVAACRACR